MDLLELMDKTSQSLIISAGEGIPSGIAIELNEAIDYAQMAKAAATRRAYRSDFNIFGAWCKGRRACALPSSPEIVAAFLAFEAKQGTKPSTIARRLAAIRYAHNLAGLPSPTSSEAVKATLRGIKRTIRSRPIRKAPATSDKIVAMTAVTGKGLKGVS